MSTTGTFYGGNGATRVLMRQALGGDEFLRATWHQHNDVIVFSHWQNDTCTAAIPVRVSEVGDLATMLVTALGANASRGHGQWPAPLADDLVRPA